MRPFSGPGRPWPQEIRRVPVEDDQTVCGATEYVPESRNPPHRPPVSASADSPPCPERPRRRQRLTGACGYPTAPVLAASGKAVPVSSSETVHSRRATARSRAAFDRPTSLGAPRPSSRPSGPT